MGSREAFHDALVRASLQMSAGMLQHPDEAQVMHDLEPSFVPLQRDALAAARRSIALARRIDFGAATAVLGEAIPRTVASIEAQMPSLIDAGLANAASSSYQESSYRIADFVVSSTFSFLLPVFEAVAAESRPLKSGYRQALADIRAYMATVDEAVERWGALQRHLSSTIRGYAPEAPDMSEVFRPVLELRLDDGRPISYIDSRVIRQGELGGMMVFENSGRAGVLRSSEGEFVVWLGGTASGRFHTVEESLAAIDRLLAKG
jgi:hypothetical protein